MTIAGGLEKDNTGDGRPASTGGMAVSPDGTVWFSTSVPNFGKVTPDGVINVAVGDGNTDVFRDEKTYVGEDALSIPIDNNGSTMVSDPNGNVFWPPGSKTGDNINVLTTSGTVHTLGGIGDEGFAGDGGPVSDAAFANITGLALDANGVIYIADWTNQRIRTLTPDGPFGGGSGGGSTGGGDSGTTADTFSPVGMHETVAGSGRTGFGMGGFSGDGGPASDAQLQGPAGLWVAANGDLYIVDTQNHRLRMVTAATGIIETIAGTGSDAAFAGDGGPATAADIPFPGTPAVDGDGNVYFTTSGRVVKVGTDGNLTVIAGNGGEGFGGDGGPTTDAVIASPFGLSVDASGNVFITDTQNHRIRMVSTDGTIVTAAGSGDGGHGASGFDGDSGNGQEAQFNFPITAAVDGSDNLFVADQNHHRIRKVSPGDGMGGGSGGDGDGSGDGSDGGTTVELPTGNIGPIGLDLDTASGDQMVRQTATNPAAGDEVDVDVFIIDGASGQLGFNVTLTWDPAEVTFVEHKGIGIFNNAVALTTPSVVTPDNSTVDLSIVFLGNTASGDAGSGATATFKINEGFSGVTTINLTAGSLGSTAVEIGPGAAFVVIGGSAAQTPAQAANFDGDGTVGLGDFLVFAGGFGKTSDDPEFDSRLDLDGDGQVGFTDFLQFAAVFGQTL